MLDGFSHPSEYLACAKELGLTAFAITEHGNQYSWVYFDELSKKYPEIKLLFGVEFYECDNVSIKDKNNKYYHLVAIAKNERGRIALNELITRSNFEGFYSKPRVDIEMLRPYANDLIILSACLASRLSKTEDYNECVSLAYKFAETFPMFYLEMQSHETEDQAAYNKKILKISQQTNIPFVITTDSHAATKEDLEFQEWHVRIARDSETLGETYSGCYLQSVEEIHSIMDEQIGYENVKLGLENTNKVADIVDQFHMPWQDPKLPTFPLPQGYSTNHQMLVDLCHKGWAKRGINNRSKQDQEIRRKRMEYELSIIEQMGYSGYFLIVWDFIKHARENNIIVGDGRGSGGGAIVNYLLGISELDPIDNNLIFERFLNPERVSLPDIDTDFANREAIIDYLIEKYGEDHVCQIINFNYITPNVAIKDTARALGVPYNIADRIAKKFTYDSFDECIRNNQKLIDDNLEYKELFRIARKIDGRVRNASLHAGGVCIFDEPVNTYMAMKVGGNGEHVIQVDKKKIEQIGGVKFDILGVKTLQVVQDTLEMANISPDDISISNPKFYQNTQMYRLLCEAKTNSIFQTESQGMKDLLLRLQPSNLEDISAVLALYRPDSMPMLEDFIHNKHHPEDITYLHPDMEPILQQTYGCMIYQESLMDIVRKFAGRSYGGADLFRKAIGKKDKKLVQEESEKLYQEIIDNGYDERIAKSISDTLAEKGGYMFNKSHSALYSILTLKTAYLKANYPTEFFCAVFNRNKSDYGSLNKYIIDALELGVKVVPPHINKSGRDFTIDEKHQIRFGLEAIKGIGSSVVDSILQERGKGQFKSLEDLLSRVNLSTSHIVNLIKSGAIPCKNKHNFLLKYGVSLFNESEYKPVVSYGTRKNLLTDWGIDIEQYKNGKFVDKEAVLEVYNKARKVKFQENQKAKRQQHIEDFIGKYMEDEEYWEFQALSVFLSNNPFKNAYEHLTTTFEETVDGGKCVVVGIVSGIQKKKDRNKNQYAFINLNSAFGLFEITCWSSQYKQYEELIKRGNQVAVLVKKNQDKAIVDAMKPYSQWLRDRKLEVNNVRNI